MHEARRGAAAKIKGMNRDLPRRRRLLAHVIMAAVMTVAQVIHA